MARRGVYSLFGHKAILFLRPRRQCGCPERQLVEVGPKAGSVSLVSKTARTYRSPSLSRDPVKIFRLRPDELRPKISRLLKP